jgi:peptide deformylase
MADSFHIHQLGSPILREHALPVVDIAAPFFQAQLDDLMDFVLEKKGMGIAAPQVGISQQFFIMSSHPNERYPHAPDVPPFFVINPCIIWQSEELEKDWEGCLSLPGIRGFVPRSKHIKVRYQTRDAEWVETEYTDFLARVFQHEYDHLIGHVFIDRVDSTLDIIMEAEWRKWLYQK